MFEFSVTYLIKKKKQIRFATAKSRIRYDLLHSFDDEPAYSSSEGSKFWYKNGKRHRDGDKPAIILANGSKIWFKNGLEYKHFNLTNIFHFQLFIIFIFNIKKNKQAFHPANLTGKLIKNELYKLLEK